MHVRTGCQQAHTTTKTEAERCTDTSVLLPVHKKCGRRTTPCLAMHNIQMCTACSSDSCMTVQRELTVGQERGPQSSQEGPASGGWGVAAQAAPAVLKLGLAHGTCSGPVSHDPQL